jgi:hypothetical protein
MVTSDLLDSSAPRPERRRYPRNKVAIQAELHLEVKGAPARLHIADLSLGGCYIETMFTMSVGAKLKMILWIGDKKLEARALVVTCHPQFGNGIEFTWPRQTVTNSRNSWTL